MSTDLVIPGTVTATGLVLPDGLSFEEWQTVCAKIGMATKACLWWWGDALNYGEAKWGEMYAQALDESDYQYGVLRNAKWVAIRIPLSCRHDKLSFEHHYQVAGLSEDQRNALLDTAEAEGLTRDELRRLVRQLKPRLPPPPIPAGVYSVVLADPPWQYDFSPTDSRQIENQYETMDVEAICALGPMLHFADDCALFLWATAPKLLQALQVMEAWGFEYVTNAVWDKEIIGMGYWFRGQHELLLVGTQGTCHPPAESVRVASVIRSRRAQHSEKPASVYELIEAAFPEHGEANKLEMFARGERTGWTQWGNEIA